MPFSKYLHKIDWVYRGSYFGAQLIIDEESFHTRLINGAGLYSRENIVEGYTHSAIIVGKEVWC